MNIIQTFIILNMIFKNKIKKYLSNIKISDSIYSKFIKNNFVVFLFHEINDNPSQYQKNTNISITQRNFKFQIEYIKNNFEIIDPKNLDFNKSYKKKALITFDDGFYGSIKETIPFLDNNSIHSIHFLNSDTLTGHISLSGLKNLIQSKKTLKKIFRDNKINYLKINNSIQIFNSINNILSEKDKNIINKHTGKFINYDQLHELTKKYKYFTIANHLSNHYVSSNLTINDLSESYSICKEILKHYNNYIDYFSYPFGQYNIHYNKNTNNHLLRNHAQFIFTANPINYKLNKNLVHRVPMFNNLDTEDKIKNQIIISYIKEKVKFKNFK